MAASPIPDSDNSPQEKVAPNYVKPVPIELSILNDIPHNQITINNITNIFNSFPVVLSCHIRIEAQHAAPLHVLSIVHRPLKIVSFFCSYVKKSKQIKSKNFVMTLMEIYCYLCRCIRKK